MEKQREGIDIMKTCKISKFIDKKFGRLCHNDDNQEAHCDQPNESNSLNSRESNIPIRKMNKCLDLDQIKENLRIKRDNSTKNAKLKRDPSDKPRNKPVIAKNLSRTQSSSIPCLSETKLKRRHSGTTVDTAFARQVVESKSTIISSKVIRSKSARIQSSTMEDRKQAALQAFANRRTPSPNVMAEDPNLKKKVEKALKVRFYLLQQRGPNSFLIGGDAPDHKYKVVIGPQSCSCTRKQCLHILFVMLRVFKVERNDPSLWSVQLKNFEVEALFRKYYQRREQRIADMKRRMSESIHSKTESCTTTDGSLSEDSQDGLRLEDEEESCPICLSEILDGESLNNCDKWFAECQKSERRLTCPLCDEKWHTNIAHNEVTANSDSLLLPSVSPGLNTSELPHTIPVSADLQPYLVEWGTVIGENLSSCLLSTNWNFRETGLKELSKTASQTLSISAHDVSIQTNILQCSMKIIAFTLNDPVYKVFIQSLKTLRNILAFTPCRNDSERNRLETLLKPVLDSLLNKCANSNRKTKVISLSAILGFIKGQEGELSIGKELDGFSPTGVDELTLVLECISGVDETRDSTPFQHFLGRLFALELLLDRYKSFFLLNECIGEKNSRKCSNLHKINMTLYFLKKTFFFNHVKVATLSKKLLFNIIKIQDDHGIKWILTQYENSDFSIADYIRKKLANSFERIWPIKNEPPQRELLADSNYTTHVHQVQTNSYERDSTAGTYYHCQPLQSDAIAPPSVPVPKEDDRPLTAPEKLTDGVWGSDNTSLTTEGLPLTQNCSAPSCCQCFTIDHGKCSIKSIHLSETLSNQEVVNSLRNISLENSTLNENQLHHSCMQNILKISHTDDKLSTTIDAIPENGEYFRPESRLGFIDDDSSSETQKLAIESDISNSLITDLTSESTDDRFSELDEDKDVFTIEVATSPTKNSDECKCKEEVEIEEDKALVEALLRSEQQSKLPNVPGLKCLPLDSHVTDQAETHNVEPYIENLHWVKGPTIGTGGFCTCYLARDKRTGTLMACKQICLVRNNQKDEEVEIAKIEAEIRLVGKLSHPNILRLLGATRHGSHFFMFTEWMPGGSIANLLETYGCFTENVTIKYIRQVILGLAYLHENRILHRDLKGANLVVDSSGQRIRIADFGASATLQGDMTGLDEFRNELMGTIPFMAPEVLKGESYGRSADVWSVGCIIIQMLTAKPPWSDRHYEKHYALIFRIGCATEGPPLPTIESPPLKDLCLRCLEIVKGDRSAAKDLIKHPLFTMCTTH
ncbi:DgyrCDS1050 [Dimorphilus gyrociliatus]|uniref:DgyrCDS1050 n=1 Tax=Dimorphilus gyrociliatus TaxID=2664684 RepID=A0A7I8V990_9ANNE|nr:DgyrCDS1050 [Dimorphilus gyrociliatus]